jgi:hypothetical protein
MKKLENIVRGTINCYSVSDVSFQQADFSLARSPGAEERSNGGL